MSQPTDNAPGCGEDSGREATTTAPSGGWQASADRNPDDFGPDSEDGAETNPDSGAEYGSIDNSPEHASGWPRRRRVPCDMVVRWLAADMTGSDLPRSTKGLALGCHCAR
jgi:hypothetical protein